MQLWSGTSRRSPAGSSLSLIRVALSNLRYEIMNFQRVTPGVYDYINIGSWHEGVLSLDEELIQMNRSDMVRSVCSEPCSKGEIKVRGESKRLAP